MDLSDLGAKLIVIDPITVLGMQTDSLLQLRTDLIRFSSMLKELDSTSYMFPKFLKIAKV